MEDTSTVMTRDEYVTDRTLNLLDSYDDRVMPWGLSHRDAWKQVVERPFVAGELVIDVTPAAPTPSVPVIVKTR